ncbi:rhodanese-like domain-containing protein [Leptospira dzoumogneensis]|uniref:Rhodanese domain-containing protein n=1 Tax=Leptospira dzoumogneensis TaxID=2484904 RepID=A0A4Z1AIX0_9LEPT|nr:rhodanese-like domain-containing protein [Leptospira dzoumogneensis]TGM98563.1 hypothetical protein EHR06_11550 [Leptospira dzoumogneensis]
MSIAVAVPTGNIGKFLLPKLLESGKKITVLTRSPQKLDPTIRERVRIQQGALEDENFILEATKGTEALHWLNPGNKKAEDVHGWYRLYEKSVSNAVQKNKIEFVVNISTIIPEVVEAGVADGIVHVEEYLNETDANVAADYLLNKNWKGKKIHVLHGGEDLTFEAAVKSLSAAVGTTLKYNYISLENFYEDLVAKGYIPCAINIPHTSLTDPKTGKFLSKEDLKLSFRNAGVDTDSLPEKIICYCNGGVSATVVVTALGILGIENIPVYDGSWNEWGKDENRPKSRLI